jgi:hypothetical protein
VQSHALDADEDEKTVAVQFTANVRVADTAEKKEDGGGNSDIHKHITQRAIKLPPEYVSR